jgi:hypothetical protein
MSRSIARGGRVVALTACALALAAGCGQSDWHYVTNDGEQTYIKIPREWNQIPASQLESFLVTTMPDSVSREVELDQQWYVGYDAADTPSSDHLFGIATDEPAIYLNIRQIPSPQRGLQAFPESPQGNVSYDVLRNAFFPTTDEARSGPMQQGLLAGFELLDEEILTPGDGVHGVRIIYNYSIGGGPLQTFDQTAYTTDDASRVYLMVIRCSAECYRDKFDELNEIAESFTVRGPE